MELEERFWDKVNKNGPIPPHCPHLGKCWIWEGATTKAGYGMISLNGKPVYVHRLAWEMEHGPIPQGMWVLHKCDNPPCVRHLFLGTQKANTQDCLAKGRLNSKQTFIDRWRDGRFAWQKGESNPRSVLTDAKVNEIRRLHRDEHWGYKRIHKYFNISFGLAQRIVNRKAWKHLPDPPPQSTTAASQTATTQQSTRSE